MRLTACGLRGSIVSLQVSFRYRHPWRMQPKDTPFSAWELHGEDIMYNRSIMRRRGRLFGLALGTAATVALMGPILPGGGIQAQATPTLSSNRLNMRRAQATRAELEVSLAEIDTILASPGYSSRIRDAKRREGMMIRERLLEGDLQVGDQIALVVQGEPQFTDTLTVGPGRVISLPGVPDIALRGILRSEAQEHLTVELRKYVRDPSVRVQALIRMSVRGAVGNPGFYQVPAELLVSDAIMLAGGPSGMADPNKTEVRRAGSVLLTESEIQEAIIRGSTLDQLNLRAGDELIVDTKQVAQSRGRGINVFTVLSATTTVVFMLTRIFR